jgi:hypothetical protein
LRRSSSTTGSWSSQPPRCASDRNLEPAR